MLHQPPIVGHELTLLTAEKLLLLLRLSSKNSRLSFVAVQNCFARRERTHRIAARSWWRRERAEHYFLVEL